eukprot:6212932-Pleurochrysis_carterae.AAC.2
MCREVRTASTGREWRERESEKRGRAGDEERGRGGDEKSEGQREREMKAGDKRASERAREGRRQRSC